MKTPNIVDARRVYDPDAFSDLSYVAIGVGHGRAQPQLFQMASTLNTSSRRQMILANGAQSKNIFWAVGSSATLGTSSVFKGTIMANQSITFTTGAELDGRALARIALYLYLLQKISGPYYCNSLHSRYTTGLGTLT